MISRAFMLAVLASAGAALLPRPFAASLHAQALLLPPKLTPAQQHMDDALRPLRDTVTVARVALLRLQQDANSNLSSDQLLGSHARNVAVRCAAAASLWPASREAMQKAELAAEKEPAWRELLQAYDGLKGTLDECEKEFGTMSNQNGAAVRKDGAKRAERMLYSLQHFNNAAARFAGEAGFRLLPTPPRAPTVAKPASR